MRTRTLMIAAAFCLAAGAAEAEFSNGAIKIGVMNDQSGTYADLAGPGSVWASKKAVEDFCKAQKCHGKIEVIFADHQNKPDIGSGIARRWYDVEQVDVMVDVPTSSVALAVNNITKEKNKVFLVSGAASSDLTGKACSPNTIHWTYDTWMLANGTGSAIVKTGGDSWFFLTADYAFGHALERDTEAVVAKMGGKTLGKVRHPLNTQDFSSFLLQAQASKAKIVGLANAGGDTTNSIKQAAEFGIVKGGQNLAGMLVFLTDIHALGLPTALTVHSDDGGFAHAVAGVLHGPAFRAYTGDDMRGAELGGAMKNVLAVATGVADGMQLGLNARAGLITRGLNEMLRLNIAIGGRPETLMGLAGLGDLVLTCTGDLSRNRRLGLALGRGQSIGDAVREIGQVVESIQTADEVMRQADACGVELPIASNVRDVLHGDITPAEGLKRLMAREQKAEYPQSLFGD